MSTLSTVRRQDYDRKRLGNGEDVTDELTDDEGAAELQSWKDVLIDALRKMDPSAFERLAQRILREAGFIKVEVTGRSGDGGIDGIGVLRVNLLCSRSYSSASGIRATSRPAKFGISVAL